MTRTLLEVIGWLGSALVIVSLAQARVLRFRVLKEIWVLLLVIATVGVLITAAITAFAAREFLGVSVGTALLLDLRTLQHAGTQQRGLRP